MVCMAATLPEKRQPEVAARRGAQRPANRGHASLEQLKPVVGHNDSSDGWFGHDASKSILLAVGRPLSAGVTVFRGWKASMLERLGLSTMQLLDDWADTRSQKSTLVKAVARVSELPAKDLLGTRT